MSVPLWLVAMALSLVAFLLVDLASNLDTMWNGRRRRLYRRDEYGTDTRSQGGYIDVGLRRPARHLRHRE